MTTTMPPYIRCLKLADESTVFKDPQTKLLLNGRKGPVPVHEDEPLGEATKARIDSEAILEVRMTPEELKNYVPECNKPAPLRVKPLTMPEGDTVEVFLWDDPHTEFVDRENGLVVVGAKRPPLTNRFQYGTKTARYLRKGRLQKVTMKKSEWLETWRGASSQEDRQLGLV